MMPFLLIDFPAFKPIAIEIGPFAIRWYALAYICGIVFGWLYARSLLTKERLWGGPAPMSLVQIDDFILWVTLGMILGGRTGYVLFYNLPFFIEHPAASFRQWEGGMSFHGGFLGVATAGLVFSLRHKASLLSVADLLALATPPGLFLGRLANFINNELWGRPTDVPWAVIFPGDAAQDCLGVVSVCARHPSQIYEALLEGLLLGTVLIYLAWRRGWLKMPGALTGTFLVGYGAARSFVELFRQPDAQFVAPGNPVGHAIHFGDWGLTMGQVLSAPMILVGLALILFAVRQSRTETERDSSLAG